MKLFASLTSPYARKVRIALLEKRIDCQLEVINPWDDSVALKGINPLGKVPTLLLDDGTVLYDSRVIVEYLDALSPVSKLLPGDMQGGCFSISSLGGIGGTAFTPIINAPEVAILRVSKSAIKPVWNGKEFAPRVMLPLSLSYDHRVIDGAAAARFTSYLSQVLGDIRRLML